MISNREAPVFYVKIVPPGASAAPIDVSDRAISLTYDDQDNKIDKVDLQMDNFDLSIFDDPNWKKGNAMIVAWGYAGRTTPPTSIIIQSITGGTVINVTAYAKSVLMNKVKRSRTFENMKRSDIVAKIATENGYGSSAQFIDDTEVSLPHTHQARMTDAEFLQHLARREGFVFYVGPDGLHFERRKMNTAPVRQFIYYSDPEQGDVLTFNVENDITVTPGVVHAKGRDPLNKNDIDETASNETTIWDGLGSLLETAAPAPPPEAATGTGDDIQKQVDARTATTQDIPIAKDATILTNATTSAGAKREADGKFIHAQQATVMMTLDCVGDPLVSAKKVIDVQGLGKRLSGRYYVRAAKHTVSADSYRMVLSLRSDGTHGGPAATDNTSNASKNTKPDQDPDALVPKKVVDGRTGQTETQWVRGTDGSQ